MKTQKSYSSTATLATSTSTLPPDNRPETRIYKRRWLMLALFCFHSATNILPCVQYTIVARIAMFYYNISANYLIWTVLCYLAAYVLFILPATWFLNKHGLRKSILLGALGNAVGGWIKCGSSARHLFGVAFAGQTIIGTSLLFVLGIPARLAAIWFGPKEVSTACAIGVFGNQIGMALGFVLPTAIIVMRNDTSEATKIADIERGFTIYNFSYAAFATLLLILLIFFFQDHPPFPASLTTSTVLDKSKNYMESILLFLKNRNFLLLGLSYGLNVAVYYAISTLLGQMFLIYFPKEQQAAGLIGLTIILCGLLGSILSGIFLDKTHKFKETILVIVMLNSIFMLTFTFIMKAQIIGLAFLNAALLGFSMTAFLPVGFEFAAELTYPESEGTSSGLLNASLCLFGIILTIIGQNVMDKWGDVSANLMFTGVLLLALLVTAMIKPDLRRQKALHQHQNLNLMNLKP